MSKEWRTDETQYGYALIEGRRTIGVVDRREDAERIVRAMSWESKSFSDLTALRDAVERYCRGFEQSALPGGALIVGDLRAALESIR